MFNNILFKGYVLSYVLIKLQEKERYKEPVRESLKALLAIGWSVEHSEVDIPSTNRSSMRRQSKSGGVSIAYLMC